MSLENNMTKIMNVVRHFTGTTDRLSFDDAVNQLLKLKPNGLTATNLELGTDFNQFFTPGVYQAWLKPMKNIPMAGSDQGSIFVVASTGDWTLQLLFTFYSGVYYRADTKDAIQKGKKWQQFTTTVVGGVVKAVLSALLPVRGCLA